MANTDAGFSGASWAFGAPEGPASRVYALRGYAAGLLVVALSTAVSVAGKPIVETAAFVTVFPLGVLLVTMGFGVGPAVFAGISGLLVFDFVFVPPALAFAVPDAKNSLTLALMIAVAGVTSVLAELLRRQVRIARQQVELEKLRNALLSALSHDLRTPLTALVTASTALCDERLPLPDRRDFSHMIADEARRLNRLVNNLLEMTRLESGRIATTPTALQALDEIIGAALAHLEGALLGHHVRTIVPERIPLLAFDPILIEQLLVNLIENVIRHAGTASPIEIEARVEGRFVVVDVSDRGPGVPPGDEARVFERHYRSDNAAAGGFGLGLTICRAIATAHGGSVWFRNRLGGGAVVSFALPTGAASKSRSPVPVDAREHEG